jgi:hypothetical protein
MTPKSAFAWTGKVFLSVDMPGWVRAADVSARADEQMPLMHRLLRVTGPRGERFPPPQPAFLTAR